MVTKSVKIKPKPVDIVLGSKIYVGEDHPGYALAKTVPTVKKEKIKIRNPITGKQALVVLERDGTTDKKLGAIMLSPDATTEQKLGMTAQFLFEQGYESGSFLAELFISKGVHTKETTAFKNNIRFDYHSLTEVLSTLLTDIATALVKDIENGTNHDKVFRNLAQRLSEGSNLVRQQRDKIAEERLRDKGFGVYINKKGQAFSIYEEGVEEAMANDKKQDD